MAQSTTARAATFILRELIGDLLYWPIWWYTLGLRETARNLSREWLKVAYVLSLKVMLRSLFKPMYADYSRSGRIISFFMRLILLAWRVLLLFLWTIVAVVLLLLWIIAPIGAAALLIRHVTPL